MDSDAYGLYQSFPEPDKSTRKVFSFPFSSRPNPSSENKSDSQDNHSSNGASFFPRGLKSSAKNPGFNQLRNEQHQSAQIFSSNHFQTPQRVPKQEPTSPVGFGEHLRLITPTANVKSFEPDTQFHANYHPQEGSHKRHYISIPSDEHRKGSLRAVSLTPSNHSGTQNSEVDDDDLDLSDLMNRRMKEAKVVKLQLAEERVLVANLRSQATSLQSSNSDLKKRIMQLEAATEQYKRDSVTKLEEVKGLEELLAAAQATQQSQLTVIGEKEEQRLEQSERIAMLQKKLKESDERVAKVKDTAKKGIENLGRSYQMMQAAFDELKHKQEHSRKNLEDVKNEIVDLKFTATEKFKEIEPFFDPSGRHLLKSTETRELVQELQNDRNDAQRVIDMLRDKLHLLGAQVVEHKEKIEVLENMRKDERVDLLRTARLLEVSSDKWNQVAGDLHKRETTDAALTAEATKLDLKLADAEDRIIKMQTELEKKDTEVDRLNNFNSKLNLELQLTSNKLEDALQRQAIESERLVATQGQLRSQEQEIFTLRGNVEGFEKSEESLRANASNATAKVAELEELIRNAHATEVDAVANYERLLETKRGLELEIKKGKKECDEKVKILEARIEKMGRELTQSEDESRQATNRFTVLQERFDSQTTMLRLTKEHNGDLQERLLSSEAVNAAKLEANEGKYKTENAVLAEQRSTLQRQVEELKTQLANLQTSSSKFKSDIETTLEELKTDKVTLMEQNTRLEGNLDHLRGDCATLECQRADLQREKKALQEALEKGSEEVLKLRNLVENYDKAATLQLRNAIERVDGHITALTGASLTEQEHSNKLLETECKRADFAEKSFEHASVQIHELKMELSTLGAELKATKDAAVIVQEELTRAQAVEGQMKTTLARIEALESENECLRKMENTMQERYQTGELTNSEKELVSLVMKTTQTMHEQEIVEKENELRRKDNMVGAMQAKIDALESTLAKCLKNQDHDQTGQSKSMVDLNIWMSSSPLSTSSGPASQTRSSVIVNRRLITDNPGRMASRPESPTFAQLEAGENRSGSEDKLPDLEPTRPTKKPKLSSARKVEVGDETKPKRGNARKRRN